jgi:hypothetical protein
MVARKDKPLKSNVDILEMSEALQGGLSIIPDEKDDILTITISHTKKDSNELPSNISFTRKSESGLIVFIPDSKEIWQKWLGEFWAKNCKDKDE